MCGRFGRSNQIHELIRCTLIYVFGREKRSGVTTFGTIGGALRVEKHVLPGKGRKKIHFKLKCYA